MSATAAVIGCGDVSVVHLVALDALADVQLIAVCDIDPDVAAAAGAKYGVPSFTDHRQLLSKMRPDVVHICTPHHQHADVAVHAIEGGVHVLLEKPVAHTLDDAGRVTAAAEARPEVKVGVCLQNRYNITAQAIRAPLASGHLGKVLGGYGTVLWHRTPEYYRSRPWRGIRAMSGGGVLINQAIHTVDLLQWLLGVVSEVSGYAGRHHPEGVTDVEDTAQVVLHHANGARSVLFATTANVRDAPVTLEIVTDQALLHLHDDLTVRYADGRVERVEELKSTSVGCSYWGVSHSALISDFYRRLAEPAPFWISPREAAKSLHIVTEVYDMSRGRDPRVAATHGNSWPQYPKR
jgi:predicted dehydrogenase